MTPQTKAQEELEHLFFHYCLIPTFIQELCQVTPADRRKWKWISQNPPVRLRTITTALVEVTGSRCWRWIRASWIATQFFHLLLPNNEAKKFTLAELPIPFPPDKAVNMRSINNSKVKHYQLFRGRAEEGERGREGDTECDFSHQLCL